MKYSSIQQNVLALSNVNVFIVQKDLCQSYIIIYIMISFIIISTFISKREDAVYIRKHSVNIQPRLLFGHERTVPSLVVNDIMPELITGYTVL